MKTRPIDIEMMWFAREWCDDCRIVTIQKICDPKGKTPCMVCTRCQKRIVKLIRRGGCLRREIPKA